MSRRRVALLSLAAAVWLSAAAVSVKAWREAQPWGVSAHRLDLLVMKPGGFVQGHCGGSAVSRSVLLTATHCLPPGLLALKVDGKLVKIVDRADDGSDHTLLKLKGVAFKRYSRLNTDAKKTPGEKVSFTGSPGPWSMLYRSGEYSGQDDEGSLYNMPVFPGDSGSGVYDSEGNLIDVVSAFSALEYEGGRLQLLLSKPWLFKRQVICRIAPEQCEKSF